MIERPLRIGDLVKAADSSLVVLLRGGARPLGLRAYRQQSEPVRLSCEIGGEDLEPASGPLQVVLEETLDSPEGVWIGRVREAAMARILKLRIALDVELFTSVRHSTAPFTPGESVVPYAGRVFDADEVKAAVDSSLDFWLTLGPHGERFQRGLSSFLGVRSSILVNSGSSANLCAFAALTSDLLGDRAIKPGDEVITAAAGFPTTVNPILQHGAVPVFVDSDIRTGNIDANLLEQARGPRTRAVMVAHALGNPVDLEKVVAFCQKHDLWFVEDNCDALGSLYQGRLTGTYGDLSTQSFYPPHHLTMGEGGAVNVVRDVAFKRIVESFRDWGRDCWCDSGQANTCGKRFDWQLGELPAGYDHKYIYSHLGYNLKPLDLQAAIGVEQLRKLPSFVAARRRNWKRLHHALEDLQHLFELPQPTPGSEPSWFGFMLLVKAGAGFARGELVQFLEARKIQTRMLFGGNLARQPAYLAQRGKWRVSGSLDGADRLMRDAFFVGVYPGLDERRMDWIAESIRAFAMGSR